MTYAQGIDFLMAKSRPVNDASMDLQALGYFMAYYHLACEFLDVEP